MRSVRGNADLRYVSAILFITTNSYDVPNSPQLDDKSQPPLHDVVVHPESSMSSAFI